MSRPVFLALMALCFFGAILLGGCSHKPLTPPQAAPAVEVLVPVATPCQVEQVAASPLPTASTSPSMLNDIYDAVKLVLADRAVLKADRTQMAAANSNPCPGATK